MESIKNNSHTIKRNSKLLLLRALHSRSNVYSNLSMYDKCLEDIQKAVMFSKDNSINDLNINLNIDLADILMRKDNDFAKAEEILLGILNTKKNIESSKKASIYNMLGISYMQKRDLKNALLYLKRTKTIYLRNKDQYGIVTVSNNIGMIYQEECDLKNALQNYRISIEYAEKVNDKKGMAITSLNIGNIYHVKCKYDLALEYFLTCLEISEGIGLKRGVGMAANCIGNIYFDKGDLEGALYYYNRSLDTARKTNDLMREGITLGNIALINQFLGKYEKARKFLFENIGICKKLNYSKGIGIAYLNLGGIYYEESDLKNMIHYLEKADKIFMRSPDPNVIVDVHIMYSQYYYEIEQYEKAHEYAQKAMKIATENEITEKMSAVFCNLGKAQMKDNKERGIEYLLLAIKEAKRSDMTYEYGVSLYEYTKILIEEKRFKEAKKNMVELENAFKKMNMAIWLKRISRLNKLFLE